VSTRFYMSTLEEPGITPAVHANWEQSPTQIPRGKLNPSPEGSFNPASNTGILLTTPTKSATTTPWDMLLAQLISDPLPVASTLNGTATLVMSVYENAAANDMMLQCMIRVVSGDGLTVRGTAYAGQTNATVVTTRDALNQEVVTGAPFEARVMAAVALSSVSVQAGDRIIVEVGLRSLNAAATGTGSGYAVDSDVYPMSLDMMPFATKLPTPPSGIRPWIEFSTDLYPTLTAEQYRYKHDGIILNTSPSLPFVDITSIEGLDAAELRLQSHDREGIHGGYADATFETLRTVAIEGIVYADPAALETYLDQLKANFEPSRRPKRLFFGTDAGARFVWGKSLGIRFAKDNQRGRGVVPFQVQITCEDPRIYSANADQIVSVLSTSTTTFTTLAGSFGNRESPLVLRILGPASAGAVSFTWNNKSCYFDLTYALALGSNDALIIDFDKRSVLLNYTSNARSDCTINSSGDWPSVSDSKNRYLIRHTTGSAYNAQLLWTPAWR